MAESILALLLHALLAVTLGNGLDHDRFSIRQRAQSELSNLPATAIIGVQLLAQRSPECHEQAYRWFAAKRTKPTPHDYGVLCYGDWHTGLLLFALRHDRYVELLRQNGIVESYEVFLFEINPIQPREHIDGLRSVRQRIGTIPLAGQPNDCVSGITRRHPQ